MDNKAQGEYWEHHIEQFDKEEKTLTDARGISIYLAASRGNKYLYIHAALMTQIRNQQGT